MMKNERGSVVAETALVLPTLLLVLTMLMTGISVLNAKLKCNQVAASVARAVERGEPDWQLMAREALPDSQVSVETNQQWVAITVSQSLFFNIKVQGSAVALQRL